MNLSCNHFQADIHTLPSMLDWVRECLLQGEFESAAIRKIELAVEEALVNVIRYAYQEQKGAIELTCRFYPEDRIELTIKDKGPPFNPLKREQKIDPAAPLEEREEGGLGILLMREYMDEVHYERQGPNNVLTLTKKIF